MNKFQIEFSYLEQTEDYDEVKRVEVTCRSIETDDIISSFVDFCASIGIVVQTSNLLSDEDDESGYTH